MRKGLVVGKFMPLHRGQPVTIQNIEKVTVFQISDEQIAIIDQAFEDLAQAEYEKRLDKSS